MNFFKVIICKLRKAKLALCMISGFLLLSERKCESGILCKTVSSFFFSSQPCLRQMKGERKNDGN